MREEDLTRKRGTNLPCGCFRIGDTVRMTEEARRMFGRKYVHGHVVGWGHSAHLVRVKQDGTTYIYSWCCRFWTRDAHAVQEEG